MKSGRAWSRSTGSWTPTTCPFASRSQRLSESGVWELPFATFVQALLCYKNRTFCLSLRSWTFFGRVIVSLWHVVDVCIWELSWKVEIQSLAIIFLFPRHVRETWFQTSGAPGIADQWCLGRGCTVSCVTLTAFANPVKRTERSGKLAPKAGKDGRDCATWVAWPCQVTRGRRRWWMVSDCWAMHVVVPKLILDFCCWFSTLFLVILFVSGRCLFPVTNDLVGRQGWARASGRPPSGRLFILFARCRRSYVELLEQEEMRWLSTGLASNVGSATHGRQNTKAGSLLFPQASTRTRPHSSASVGGETDSPARNRMPTWNTFISERVTASPC
jgi:hypothetical protein